MNHSWQPCTWRSICVHVCVTVCRCFKVTRTHISARCVTSILQSLLRPWDSCRIVFNRELSAWEWNFTAVCGKVCHLTSIPPLSFYWELLAYSINCLSRTILVATSLETLEIRPAILHVDMLPLVGCNDCKMNDLEWPWVPIFHVKIRFWRARLSRAYVSVS